MAKKKRSEIAFVPMLTDEYGKHFAMGHLDRNAYFARNDFVASVPYSWKQALKRGWRIVKVKVIEHG